MPARDRPEVGSFPSTHWSLVFSAKAEDTLRRQEAIGELLRIYQPALRAHLLYRRKIESHRAEDLLQGFITCQVLQRDLVAKANPEKGHFRWFFLKSLENYVRDTYKARQLEVALDWETPGRGTTDVFEVEWARQLLQETLRRMRADCAREGRSARWDLFECRVVTPSLTGSPLPSYSSLVARFGFRSAEQATNAMATAKRQFERTLRAVIAEIECVSSDEDVEGVLADLLATLQEAGPLGVEWDRNQIVGTEDRRAEDLSGLSESSPDALTSLLTVKGTRDKSWEPDELRDLLRHFLETPVCQYLNTPGLPQEFAADSPSDQIVAAMTLSELFQRPDPPLGLLIAVKRHARRLTSPGVSDMPAEVHRVAYFASIAAAIVRLGERITKSSPEVLRVAFEQLGLESWTEDWLHELFESALRRASADSRL